jgi:hypothetical protein
MKSMALRIAEHTASLYHNVDVTVDEHKNIDVATIAHTDDKSSFMIIFHNKLTETFKVVGHAQGAEVISKETPLAAAFANSVGASLKCKIFDKNW